MSDRYSNYTHEELVRMLERRDARQHYGLIWERESIEADRAVNDDYVVLDLDQELSTPLQADAGWQNLVIEGDNWNALRALRLTHGGSIKCILIDPPYNTGAKDFAYNDAFVGKDDRFRHSLWLEFLYKRLLLARDLMSDDGVILVCINDENRARLDLLMEQVFPSMRVGSFVWKTRMGSNDAKGAFLSADHEHVLIYANPKFRFGGIEKTFSMYNNPDNDPKGPWRVDNLTGPKDRFERPNSFYPLYDPKTGIWYPCNPIRVWAYASKARMRPGQKLQSKPMEEWIDEGRIVFPTNNRVEVWTSREAILKAIETGDVPRSGSGAPLLRADLPDLDEWIGRPCGWGVPAFKRYQNELRNPTQPLSSWIRVSS
ncbi:MAG TPA: site-specific DNA-methyltransferase, partial [Acetobacteraceae bacterium]|nr:site-specific DNA-methyltransferase [Acetobacteraceae bacterium]